MKPRAVYHLTADELSRALYGKGVDKTINRGLYEGTNIPLKPVPPSTPLRVVDRGIITVEDDLGGMAADRFGPQLGRRELKKLAKLSRGMAETITAEALAGLEVPQT